SVTAVRNVMLLDLASAIGRRRVRRDSDLGQMLMAALDVRPVANAVEASARYGAAALRAAAPERAPRSAEVRTGRGRSGEGLWCASCRSASSMDPSFSFRQAVAERLTQSEPR